MSVFGFSQASSFLLIAVISAAAQIDAPRISILSGEGWKSSATRFAGWETLGFDDATWSDAYNEYQPIITGPFIPGTLAEDMWHYPVGIPNGMDGAIEAYFRYSFSLESPVSGPISGQAYIRVDDDYEFFVNGNLAFENKDQGHAEIIDFVDFSTYLRDGLNVFAIHAVDGGWGSPYDRTYESVTFAGVIGGSLSAPPPPNDPVQTVPEPSSLVLLLAGFMGALSCRPRPMPS